MCVLYFFLYVVGVIHKNIHAKPIIYHIVSYVQHRERLGVCYFIIVVLVLVLVKNSLKKERMKEAKTF